jgi:hypothetical protein
MRFYRMWLRHSRYLFLSLMPHNWKIGQYHYVPTRTVILSCVTPCAMSIIGCFYRVSGTESFLRCWWRLSCLFYGTKRLNVFARNSRPISNPKFHCRIHKIPLLGSVPYMLWSLIWRFSLRILTKYSLFCPFHATWHAHLFFQAEDCVMINCVLFF